MHFGLVLRLLLNAQIVSFLNNLSLGFHNFYYRNLLNHFMFFFFNSLKLLLLYSCSNWVNFFWLLLWNPFRLLSFDAFLCFNWSQIWFESLSLSASSSNTLKLFLYTVLSFSRVLSRVCKASRLNFFKPSAKVGLNVFGRASENLVLEHRTFHKDATVLTSKDHFHCVFTCSQQEKWFFLVKVISIRHV